MLHYYIADAFADAVFEGNPAGVCILDAWIPLETMDKIAVENNLSETAFAVKESEDTYGLRWFTPGGEIDLCGHATLATAYILFRFFETDCRVLRFEAKKCHHRLTVERQGDLLLMDFPSIAPREYAYADYMAEALGEKPAEVWCTDRDMLFVFASEEAVKTMKPDFSRLREFPHGLSVYVTAKSTDYDFVARAFWPKININEDPVCGAMYCTLIPFWRERLGKDDLVARQVSARGGTVYGRHRGDRVTISGRAALYAEGNLYVDVD